MGRIRLQVVLDCTACPLETFIMRNIEPGSLIATNSWRCYDSILNVTYSHDKISDFDITNDKVSGVHLVASLVKRLIRGPYQGRLCQVNIMLVQNMCIVQQVVKSAKVNYKDVHRDIDPISEYFATGALWKPHRFSV